MSLDLSYNLLCGVQYGQGTYTAKGIKAVADALRVSGSLTSLNLRSNSIGAEGAKSVADALGVNGSLTSLDIRDNALGESGVAALREAVNGRDDFDLIIR